MRLFAGDRGQRGTGAYSDGWEWYRAYFVGAAEQAGTKRWRKAGELAEGGSFNMAKGYDNSFYLFLPVLVFGCTATGLILAVSKTNSSISSDRL